jgi:hypothetical protein
MSTETVSPNIICQLLISKNLPKFEIKVVQKNFYKL